MELLLATLSEVGRPLEKAAARLLVKCLLADYADRERAQGLP
jgi:hypothetical protein